MRIDLTSPLPGRERSIYPLLNLGRRLGKMGRLRPPGGCPPKLILPSSYLPFVAVRLGAPVYGCRGLLPSRTRVFTVAKDLGLGCGWIRWKYNFFGAPQREVARRTNRMFRNRSIFRILFCHLRSGLTNHLSSA
jgi:hypothetical protein